MTYCAYPIDCRTYYWNTKELFGYDITNNNIYTIGHSTNTANPCFIAYQMISGLVYTKMAVYYNGNVWIGGTLTQNSDIRIKNNINTLNSSYSLSNVLNLNPVHYNRVEDNIERVGLIANEVLDVFPELVNKNDYAYHDTSNNIKVDVPDCLNMDYVGLIPYLISSIQELNKKIEFLEKNKKDKD